MLRTLLATLISVVFVVTAVAAEFAEADKAEFRRMISDQIAAFNADDGPRAYSHAAPIIRQVFSTTEAFMAMVKKGYAPVYRQRSFTFGDVTTEFLGRPTQRVTIVDVNGKLWTALYSFEKQPDGSWKISGCVLVEVPAADV